MVDVPANAGCFGAQANAALTNATCVPGEFVTNSVESQLDATKFISLWIDGISSLDRSQLSICDYSTMNVQA